MHVVYLNSQNEKHFYVQQYFIFKTITNRFMQNKMEFQNGLSILT